ncbi:MAG: PhzF family phenazine biosynthesis protein [Acidobacteria bacterium]|nr:PhzF family phenazine biosynthesis protein [Acidobacteriota bacterium]
MRITMFQVDAFTDRLFAGNPAAVCPLDEWLPDEILRQIAAENNLSETAFFVPADQEFELRWFTPVSEVDLCGHATLATAHVLFRHLGFDRDLIPFRTRQRGRVHVERSGDRLVLDFPAWAPVATKPPASLLAGLAPKPRQVFLSRDYLALYDHEDQIATLVPDYGALSRVDVTGIIVTAPGRESDFVSRFFAPREGIPEDPVTGSAHCTLAPFWAERLGKTELYARQLSPRGGELFCRLSGDRVKIGGRAVTYLEGKIEVPVP